MTSTSRSILSSSLDTDGRRNDEEGQWEVLDFSVFERSVARKLTDEDVRTILTFIDCQPSQNAETNLTTA